MVGEGGGYLSPQAGYRTCITYMYANESKKRVTQRLEPQKRSIEVERVAYYAIETCTLCATMRLNVIRNPLGLKSEVREKYKKIEMSKTVDFLKNPR